MPVVMVSELLSEEDRSWARKAARYIGLGLLELHWGPLESEYIRDNPPDRCYWCKRTMYSTLLRTCKSLGLKYLLDGTNADDLSRDRPGLKAIKELGVRIPLAHCGYTKDFVRERSRESGLAVWNRPSQSCLATRISTGISLTSKRLNKVDKAENYLKTLGIIGKTRVRYTESGALIQIAEYDKKFLKSRWKEVEQVFQDLGFTRVELEGVNSDSG